MATPAMCSISRYRTCRFFSSAQGCLKDVDTQAKAHHCALFEPNPFVLVEDAGGRWRAVKSCLSCSRYKEKTNSCRPGGDCGPSPETLSCTDYILAIEIDARLKVLPKEMATKAAVAVAQQRKEEGF